MPEKREARKYLDPKILNRIARLELKARQIVEGFITGLHKSPYHGFSVEFAEHREYVPGDDIRHIDWKVWGRSDRFYIKQYEQETNLRAHLVLDTSESMRYGGDTAGMTKYDYACFVAASLGYLILRQQDAVGLALFDSQIHRFVPPSSVMAHLHHLLWEMETHSAEKKTNIGIILHNLAERVPQRGIVIILSDMFDSVENIMFGIRHLRHKKHEVIVLHILDHDELEFPFQQMTMFLGLEEYPNLLCDPRALRKAYLKELHNFLNELRRDCRYNGVDYVLMDTKERVDVALATYLARRAARTAKGSTAAGGAV